MDPYKRETLLSNSMLEQESKILGKYKIRTFSYASLNMAYALNLTLFTGAKSESVSEMEVQRQISTFMWMQTAPKDDVVNAIADGRAEKEALKFSMDIDLNEVPLILAEINKIGDQISANEVRVESKYKDTDQDTPPGKS